MVFLGTTCIIKVNGLLANIPVPWMLWALRTTKPNEKNMFSEAGENTSQLFRDCNKPL